MLCQKERGEKNVHVCCVDNVGVCLCVTCERAAISGVTPGIKTRWGRGDGELESGLFIYKKLFIYFIHAVGLFGFVLTLQVLDMLFISEWKYNVKLVIIGKII